MLMDPSVPIVAITRLGTIAPGVKLTFDAVGRLSPGYTVRKLVWVERSAVTFRMATRADAGTPLSAPRSGTFNTLRLPSRLVVRVSTIRDGALPSNPDPASRYPATSAITCEPPVGLAMSTLPPEPIWVNTTLAD